MSGTSSVRKALETRLAAMSNALPTQYQNKTFTVPDGAYQKCSILLANPDNPEMGDYYEDNGYMQIMLFFPIGSGSGDTDAYADSVRDWFPKGLSLTDDGVNVTVYYTPTISQGVEDGDRYTMPIKIRFNATNSN